MLVLRSENQNLTSHESGKRDSRSNQGNSQGFEAAKYSKTPI